MRWDSSTASLQQLASSILSSELQAGLRCESNLF